MRAPLTSITLPGRHQREAASELRAIHNPKAKSSRPSNPLRVVCISDTDNARPILPPGDLLIHARDLTENGSFDEPHTCKVIIAGNHDVLLDEAFLPKYPERRYGQTKTKADLDWGSVIYLEDNCVTLDFPQAESIGDVSPSSQPRRLTIFGRCFYLAEEIAQILPHLVVFGHIHVSYGREDVVLDGVQRAYEVMTGWAGWMTVGWMAILVLLAKLKGLVLPNRDQEGTVFVNASVVSGSRNTLTNEPIVVEF
ncbi:hypothetical protein B0J15DRAFT_538122 [Fusarium solani]|uniref:Calcineurin-like phosphoesterase domain-containing protein n=1 Tax=Fusarium solani TaxID=169388 RepID=A0A9P9GJ51_FUSSL|nr:uncharacterized protein B0J15DRAFT_538122 [Fusarium solani]KAH7240528.1 hypothetical protein B0J15DRAFT_538122 [Fusarium solani]